MGSVHPAETGKARRGESHFGRVDDNGGDVLLQIVHTILPAPNPRMLAIRSVCNIGGFVCLQRRREEDGHWDGSCRSAWN